MIGLLEVAALSAALLALATWLVVLLAAPRLGEGQGSPRQRLRAARAWLFAPLWVPALIVLAACLPGAAGVVFSDLDHCHLHAGAHHHQLCWSHPPHLSEHTLGWALPLAVGLLALFALTRAFRRLRRAHRLTDALVGLARPSDLGPDVRLLDRPEPMALAVGWRRPVVLVSAGLVERVDPETLAVVLAHERAHLAGGDTRWMPVERAVAALLPRAVAGPLLDRIALAREQRCDARAAAQVGRLAVARALTRVARLGLPPAALSIAGGALEARVALLLDPPRARRARLPWVIGGLVAAGLGPLHSAVEHVVTLLLH